MGNYYISNCCHSETINIDVKNKVGMCLSCKKNCDLLYNWEWDEEVNKKLLANKHK